MSNLGHKIASYHGGFFSNILANFSVQEVWCFSYRRLGDKYTCHWSELVLAMGKVNLGKTTLTEPLMVFRHLSPQNLQGNINVIMNIVFQRNY